MDENEMLKCDFCNESCSDEEILSTHVLSVHDQSLKAGRNVTFVTKRII